MSEKTINRDEYFGAMVPVESSGRRVGMLFGASHLIVEDEDITITESKGIQGQLELIEEWNSMSGVGFKEVLIDEVSRVRTDYVQQERIQQERIQQERIQYERELISHIRKHDIQKYVSWYKDIASYGGLLFPVEINQNWRSRVSSADNLEEIIDLFRQSDNPKFNKIADRLRELQDFYEEDPEGGDPLTIEALRTLAFFVGNNRDLPYSHISVYSDGRVYLEWRLHPQGRLAMELSPDKDLINFAAISATAEEGIERKEVSGALPEKEAIEAVRWFINRIADNAKK